MEDVAQPKGEHGEESEGDERNIRGSKIDGGTNTTRFGDAGRRGPIDRVEHDKAAKMHCHSHKDTMDALTQRVITVQVGASESGGHDEHVGDVKQMDQSIRQILSLADGRRVLLRFT